MESDPSLVECVRHLETGGLLAFPTETVWGLAARADSDAALERLRSWKGRGVDHPLSVLVPGPGPLDSLGFTVSERAAESMAAFWPGPLTRVLPCAPRFAQGVARHDGAVGVRCSPHATASTLAAAAWEAGLGLLTATSLNRSGQPPAATVSEARALCREGDALDAIPIYHGGGDAGGQPPSTVVDLTASEPVLLRAGPVALESLPDPSARRIQAQESD